MQFALTVPWSTDRVIHCRRKNEAEQILNKLKERLEECKLEIHPEKTRIVYYRSDRNNKENKQEYESFDFLGYTFRKRFARSKTGHYFNRFNPAVSKSASKSFREKIKEARRNNKIGTIYELAEEINPIIRGWANYFTKFCSSEARKSLEYVNHALVRWVRRKYKTIRRSNPKAWRYLSRLEKKEPKLFYHWQRGIIPVIR